MSYDIYAYSTAFGILNLDALNSAARDDGFSLTITPEDTRGEKTSFVAAASADLAKLVGSGAGFGKIRFDLFVAPMNDEDRNDLKDAVADLAPRAKSIARACVTRYHLFLDGLPEGPEAAMLMERSAWIIAAQAGGVCVDPMGIEPIAFAAGRPLPKWNRPFTLRDQVGPTGVRVVEWCRAHGYTIPQAFMGSAAYRYVAMITSFTPPKLHGASFHWPVQLVRLLSSPPPGYIYRAFDFEDDVEVVADPDAPDGLRPIGPIDGLPPRSKRKRGRSTG
jgi:hypothetical protein